MYSGFKINFEFLVYNFFAFSALKNKPSRSRRSASRVKEKCVRGQIQVRRGSSRSASGVNEKCIGGQGEVLPLNVWFSAKALLLDPWRTFAWPPAHFSLTPDALLLDPWRTSPWPGGLIFQSWNQPKKMWKKSPKLFLKTLYIIKYLYA